ncbi:MAG TPA: mitochondrial fission ELM1 family protein, partial [Xanthomonadaceae bacterium]|nr:mitochondrial fission ELM1 family protein [Xanthomonadaceae bacterium]
PRAPWRWMAPRRAPGSTRGFGAEFAARLADPPRLAVGCGRQAALATRLARGRGARVVQILDPRLPPSHWDLVVAPEHDALRGDNVLRVLGSLHPVDDAWLARARADFPALAALPGPRTALLLGGDSAHYRFDRTRFDALADALPRDGSLLVTTSRRTPADVAAAARALVARAGGLFWANAEDGPNPYPGLLAWADRIACTPDSVNMLSEACATRVPVQVFAPDAVRGRVRSFLDALQGLGRVGVLGDAWPTEPPTPLRETARVATEIRARLAL